MKPAIERRWAQVEIVLTGLATVIILVASAFVFGRVAVKVAVVAPSILPHVAPQLALMTAWISIIALGAYALLSKSMDGITLSTAQLMDTRGLSIETGWRMIMMLIGALSNIAFKLAVVASLGTKRLSRRSVIGLGLALVGGGLLLQLWPV